jgi:hypothetical protein
MADMSGAMDISSDAPCAIRPTANATDPPVGSTATERAITMAKIVRTTRICCPEPDGHIVCTAGTVKLSCQ